MDTWMRASNNIVILLIAIVYILFYLGTVNYKNSPLAANPEIKIPANPELSINAVDFKCSDLGTRGWDVGRYRNAPSLTV